jgi:hypothetical protein
LEQYYKYADVNLKAADECNHAGSQQTGSKWVEEVRLFSICQENRK